MARVMEPLGDSTEFETFLYLEVGFAVTSHSTAVAPPLWNLSALQDGVE
jgi:hypothetical protein